MLPRAYVLYVVGRAATSARAARPAAARRQRRRPPPARAAHPARRAVPRRPRPRPPRLPPRSAAAAPPTAAASATSALPRAASAACRRRHRTHRHRNNRTLYKLHARHRLQPCRAARQMSLWLKYIATFNKVTNPSSLIKLLLRVSLAARAAVTWRPAGPGSRSGGGWARPPWVA